MENTSVQRFLLPSVPIIVPGLNRFRSERGDRGDLRGDTDLRKRRAIYEREVRKLGKLAAVRKRERLQVGAIFEYAFSHLGKRLRQIYLRKPRAAVERVCADLEVLRDVRERDLL